MKITDQAVAGLYAVEQSERLKSIARLKDDLTPDLFKAIYKCLDDENRTIDEIGEGT